MIQDQTFGFVGMTPNPVTTGSQVLISVDVQSLIYTWGDLQSMTWEEVSEKRW